MVDISSQMNTKVRLVRCPRCREVLPELTEIPVYKCGGCGTILQAKNRKKNNNGTELSSDKTNSTQNYGHDSSSESSNQETTPSFESSPASDYKGDQFGFENHKQPGTEFSDDLPCSTELSCHGNETESPEARDSVEEGKHKCQLGQDANKYGNEAVNHNIHQPGSVVSDELPSSTELIYHGNETSSPEAKESTEQGEANCQLHQDARESTEQGEANCPLGQDARKSGDESLSSNCQQPTSNISDELPSSTGVSFQVIERLSPEAGESMEQGEHKFQLNQDATKYENEALNCSGQQPGTNFLDELPSSTELSCHGNERSSQEARESMEQGKHQYTLRQKDENESLNHNSPQPGDRTSSEVLVNSGELSFSKNEDSSPKIGEPMMQDDDRSSLRPNSEKYAKESEDDCCGRTEDGKFSNELHSSAQLSRQDTESPSLGVNPCIELNMEKDLLEQYPSRDQNESEDYKADKPEGNNFLTFVHLTGEGNHQSELSSCGGLRSKGDGRIYHSEGNDEQGQHKFSGQIESSQNIEFAREGSPSPLAAFREVEIPSMINKTYTVVNEDNVSNFKTSNIESSLSSVKGDVLVAAQSPLNEGVLSENLSPYEKYLEQSRKNVLGFDRVGSDESLVSLPTIPRYAPGAMSKSPTRIYYGGDASGSSYDGNDDQISDWNSYLYKGKFKATDPPNIHRSRKTDGFRARKMQDSKLEMHHDQMVSESIFAEKNINAITGREWSHDELPQTRRQSGAIRRMRLDTDDPISRKPYISRSSQLIHEKGSPSSYRQNVLQHRSRFNTPDTALYTEPDKAELLRMVYELEDKLDRTRKSYRTENERFSSEVRGFEKHTPALYDDLETEGNIYTDYENSIYHNGFPQGAGWLQQSNISRMAFSGEAAYRHAVDCLCSYCSPHDRQRSRHLHSHFTSSKFQYTAPPSHNHQKAFTSFSSTPQHYTSSGFSSWGQEIISDNQKYKDNEQKRLYSREKYHRAKRHIRPMASGAPIVTCSHCSELLQLPVDFLVYKRRCHQLRCNSCNRILKFSLKKMGHLSPYVPSSSTHPPTEMDEDGVAANSRTLAPVYNSNHSPHVEPVSFSDDYDPSYCRSYSTEQEHSVLSPGSCSLQKNTYKKKMSSSDSIQPIQGRIMNSISRNSRSMHLSSGEAFELVGTSYKISERGTLCSEIEELPAPLHRLMGYSSPHQVLYASPGDESEDEVNSRGSVLLPKQNRTPQTFFDT